MSTETVEMVQRIFHEWNVGDLARMSSVIHPDFEYVASGVVPGLSSSYRGRDGFRSFWRDFRETWEALQIEVEEAREIDMAGSPAGDRHAVARLTFDARARSGLEVRREFGNLLSFRDGLVVRIRAFGEWPEALRAAGLRE